jgi:hypothetical protein
MSYVMSTGANAGEQVSNNIVITEKCMGTGYTCVDHGEEIKKEDTKKEVNNWVEETHKIYKLKDGKGRVATILMMEGQFKSCQYRVKTNIYDLDNWRFIGKIVKKIEELTTPQEENNKENPTAGQEAHNNSSNTFN